MSAEPGLKALTEVKERADERGARELREAEADDTREPVKVVL